MKFPFNSNSLRVISSFLQRPVTKWRSSAAHSFNIEEQMFTATNSNCKIDLCLVRIPRWTNKYFCTSSQSMSNMAPNVFCCTILFTNENEARISRKCLICLLSSIFSCTATQHKIQKLTSKNNCSCCSYWPIQATNLTQTIF